ncbi:dimethylarginine dimethylaminohydrolase family protein [Ilumatobacter sp.]|uniref:dimethylarginine dimethylaminohydrolase family protein n=1 Tax=Ilumatobacter sp. TaxID=1967498 RepID=UPI003B517B5F
MDVFVDSETGPLRSVIVGYPDNFLQVDAEIINEAQRRWYDGPDAPTAETVTAQIRGLVDELVSRGIEVHQPHPLDYVPDQMMTRDIGVVIGRTFVVTTMAARSRRHEWRGYAHLFERFGEDVKVLFGPEDLVLEGGDIVVDRGKVFVGIGQRTNLAGAAWLMQLVPDHEIVPIALTGLAEGEDVLHLDCSFLPVGDGHALIYRDGLRDLPAALRETYELIEVTREEQRMLATNVLSLSPSCVVSRPESARINDEMRARGIEVVELAYSEPPKTGGSFRCCTLPLHRART